MNKRTAVKSILLFFAAFGATAGLLRMKSGLGAVTALSDYTPWGLWIGFDVMAGVALAAGGFVLAGAVYVFHLEKFRPFLRATVLTAFLGYVIVAVGLVFDLGLPWNIWHPAIYWQYKSVLFEVAACVMLYLNVLALETAPMVLEHRFFNRPFFKSIYKILKFFTVPLVILGIMLSTLHQSSLGSLFLIMPFKAHALWYSPIIYVLYFVSAVGLGLAMVIFESTITSYLYDHDPRTDLMAKLGKACSAVLGLYVIIRFSDLAVRGVLPRVFSGSWQSGLFALEILVSALAPLVLFNLPRVNKSVKGLFLTSGLVVAGFVMNRQDVFLTMFRPEGPLYFPSIGEIGVTLGLVSGAALVFLFFVEYFNMFEGHAENAPKAVEPRPALAMLSIPAVLGVSFALAALPSSAIEGYRYPDTPVAKAVGWDTLKIDANRAKECVRFPHAAHKERFKTGADSCTICHHMSKPGDGPTSCYECHSDMYLEKSIFAHKLHQTRLGGNKSCVKCHPVSKSRENVKSCAAQDCHPKMFAGQKAGELKYIAPSFVDAMHGKCEKCHKEMAVKLDRVVLSYCTACHTNVPKSARTGKKPVLAEKVR